MFKRKKKTGCETPKFRKPTVPPQYEAPPMPPVQPPKPPTSGSNAVKPKKTCFYETPCGWCTKWDKKCDRQPYKHTYQRGMIVFDDGSEAEIKEKF